MSDETATPAQPAPEATSEPATPAQPAPEATSEPAAEIPREPAELEYTGDASGAAHAPGIPARDLLAKDVDRLVYVRTIPEPGSPGLVAGDKDFDKVRAELVAALIKSGHYRRPRKERG